MDSFPTPAQVNDDLYQATIITPAGTAGGWPGTAGGWAGAAGGWPGARVEPLSGTVRDLAAEDQRRHGRRLARRLRLRAVRTLGNRVRHPDGGERTVAATAQDEAEQRARIAADRAMGSRRHERLPGWLRQVPKLVMVGDLGLLMYFFSGITDVNWAEPLSAELCFAVLLASVMTVLAYGFFSFTGHRLRSYKDHSGAVRAGRFDGFTKLAIAGSVVGISVVAGLMFARMHAEVSYALGPGCGSTALLVALALAAVSVLANLLVIAVHAHDGSDEADRLDRLAAATSRAIAKAHRMQSRAEEHLGE